MCKHEKEEEDRRLEEVRSGGNKQERRATDIHVVVFGRLCYCASLIIPVSRCSINRANPVGSKQLKGPLIGPQRVEKVQIRLADNHLYL